MKVPHPSPFGPEACRGELAPRAALESHAGASEGGGKPKFASDTGFHTEVKRRVLDYFEHTGLSPRDSPRMYVKTAVLLLWFGASYALLVFAVTTWWQGALLSVSLALAMAGVGFSVQHDANHGAYSSRGAINRLMGMTLDLLGASSYIWQWKHNIAHHTYTNLNGADSDIDIPFTRLSPAQPYRRIHRFQRFYVWALYGLFVPFWHFFEDFKQVAEARIARHRFPRPRGWRLIEMVGGKALFAIWALMIPMCFHPWWVVLLFYVATAAALGLILAVVFELAHCVEEADFPVPQPEGHRLCDPWAVHQVQTTVDFARGNRLLTWYVGGLNFQIEHHLFPRICHVHYPRIAEIVQSACADFGVRYTAHKSLRDAVSSHWRWLRRMGRPLPGLAARGTESSLNDGARHPDGSPVANGALTTGGRTASDSVTSCRPTPAVATVALTTGGGTASAPEWVELLDGGAEAYPRMLDAIALAQRFVHLETYAFSPSGVGERFIEALSGARRRGVAVHVLIDGWGSARGGRAVAAALRGAGCDVRVYNRLRAILVGRFGRNHRKMLLVDDEVAFLGGINIGDENIGEGTRLGWADLALEIRGPQCARLGQMIRREPRRPIESSLCIHLCGIGGGWRLRRRYLDAFAGARHRIHVAHGYFLPDLGVIRAITAAARRGVQVRLLLAGRSDVLFARAATRSLYRRLLAAGVSIHEWNHSVLHAKVATVDRRRLLVGSFNLDPFSLANLEALVEVADVRVVEQGDAWIQDHFEGSRSITSVEAGSWVRRWLLDPLGFLVARLAEVLSRVLASRRQRRVPPDHRVDVGDHRSAGEARS